MAGEAELIKERLNLAEIIGEYVPLKQTGAHFKTRCPFHEEKTPSFIVSPAKGIWHCFGCNEGGDVFSFVQKVEGLDFPAALKLLADRAGVALEQSAAGRASDGRGRLLDVLSFTSRLYQEVLLRQRAGQRAREYLAKRGMRVSTMELFQLGYAASGWDIVQRYLSSKGFTSEEMIAAGVVGRSENGKLYDRFRQRIMFPITDTQGRVVAFAGRVVPGQKTGGQGKYINSPETSLYAKRKVVYNLARAKHALRGNQPCLVVEGYMDVVMLVQQGIEHVVGTSGTAFTSDHINVLRRFTTWLHFAFDGDSAGWRATVAATQAALNAGMHVATVVFPTGQDPADLALAAPNVLAACVAQPRPLIAVLLQQLQQSQEVTTQEEQLDALLPLLATVTNPIQQGEMIQQVAAGLHVPEARVISWLTRAPAPQAVPSTQEREAAQTLALGPEHQLLGLLVSRQHLWPVLAPELRSEYFLDPRAQGLYNSLQMSQFLSSLPSEHLSFAEALRVLSEEQQQLMPHSPEDEGRTLVRVLKRRFLGARLRYLQQQLALHGMVEQEEALRQFKAVAEELGKIDRE